MRPRIFLAAALASAVLAAVVAATPSAASAAVVTRTGVAVPAPAGAGEPCAACVGVIGDSLTHQAGGGVKRITDAISARGYKRLDIRVNGLVGRSIAGPKLRPSSLEAIRDWRADGFDPAIFVIALGTNNKNAKPKVWQREVDKVLREIGPGRQVHWIGLGFKDSADRRVASFNTTVGAIEGLTFHDWNAHMHAIVNPQKPLWNAKDKAGVHMTVDGYKIRSSYYASVLPDPPAL